MKKQRRAPNPLRKWAKEIDGFEVSLRPWGVLAIETRYSDNSVTLGVNEHAAFVADVERVLSKALREAKE